MKNAVKGSFGEIIHNTHPRAWWNENKTHPGSGGPQDSGISALLKNKAAETPATGLPGWNESKSITEWKKNKKEIV